MNVVKATHAGACYGVRRALELVDQAATAVGPVYTLGPLIHNPGVVESLRRRGVFALESTDELETGTVVIRSHGVTPQVLAELSAKEVKLVDATCPHVARAQKAAADLAASGCTVLVVGEAGHPEVEGLTAYAQGAGATVCVVAGPQDVPDGLQAPVGIVVQTTQKRETLDEVIAAVCAQGIEPSVQNTICSATKLRQEEAAELARKVDAMVVLGGRNSSNTTRLAELCKAGGTPTYHIESADELDPAWFSGCKEVGVTAGASTPESQIDELVCRLGALEPCAGGSTASPDQP